MSIYNKTTIIAVATSKLPAGVGIIRLSGPKAIEVTESLAPSFKNEKNRFMHYCELVHDGEVLDKVMVVKFKAPHSFTGEDVVEIHCHGSTAVLNKVTDVLLSFEDVAPADRGEFSKRAFMNGKMDLTEAEGLCDLITAETDQQRKQALKQLDGALGSQFENWRQEVMHLLAHVEASLDFPDEELEIMEQANLKGKVEALIAQFDKAISQKAGQRLREGFSIAIIGKPNAGKSTLTNLLTGKDTAIVSDIAGTTRDVVQSHLDIAGFPVVLQDTAGIRQTDDVIEAEGVKRSYKSAELADLLLLVVDSSEINNIDEDLLKQLQPGKSIILSSKSDLVDAKIPASLNYQDNEYKIIDVNLTDDSSLDKVFPELETMLKALFKDAEDGAFLTRKRHTNAVIEAKAHLENAMKLYNNPVVAFSLADLLAQDLRDCAAKIGEITGKTDVEDLLDLVFSTFCIGK
ncbi:MAG: tRNA modification GTPase MnmE [Proteobacteria bacterium]|nr:MAG: tRNA modification GTPase MnmE [Pseudomonadota bacterium]|tara:strand:- start:1 stop:1380 length:1380 start_codon:yes stop_codon:yes gene_type:complete